jgi:hypothetical protein
VGSIDPGGRREFTVEVVGMGIRLTDVVDGIVGRDDVDTAALS